MSATAVATRAVFIDKDGTLVDNEPYNVDPTRIRFTPYALEGLRLLAERGYLLIVVTNQPGLAYRMFTRAALERLRAGLAEQMARGGAPLTDFYACPHAPGPAGRVPACLCRKPAPGLLRQAARAHRIDLSRSWMIGDILDDVEAGRRAGCRSVLLEMGNETQWRLSPLRTPQVRAAHLLEAAEMIIACEEHCPVPEPTVAADSATPATPDLRGRVRRSVRQATAAFQAAVARNRHEQPGRPG